jgi:hypothetical protein
MIVRGACGVELGGWQIKILVKKGGVTGRCPWNQSEEQQLLAWACLAGAG